MHSRYTVTPSARRSPYEGIQECGDTTDIVRIIDVNRLSQGIINAVERLLDTTFRPLTTRPVVAAVLSFLRQLGGDFLPVERHVRIEPAHLALFVGFNLVLADLHQIGVTPVYLDGQITGRRVKIFEQLNLIVKYHARVDGQSCRKSADRGYFPDTMMGCLTIYGLETNTGLHHRSDDVRIDRHLTAIDRPYARWQSGSNAMACPPFRTL